MRVVPKVRTPEIGIDVANLIVNAWRATFGKTPSRNALALILSLVWIETGRGQSIFNHNLGNISASRNWPGDAWRPPWFDLEGGLSATEKNIALHERMLRGEVPSAFRAYPTAELGALDFVRVLKGSFPNVLSAAETGNADTFRRALSEKYSKDYSTDRHTKTISDLQADALALIDEHPELIRTTPGELPALGGTLAALGIVGAAGAIFALTLRRPKRRKRAA